MTNPGVDLLKMLGSSGAAPTLDLSARGAKTDIATAGFKELLGLARKGEVPSGREVTIDPGLKVDLTPPERAALAAAADRAEAAGLNRALVILGGRGLVLDVASRSVTAAPDMSSPNVLSQIDGVVNAGNGKGQTASLLTPPAGAIGNSTLAKVLAEGAARGAGTRA